LREDNVERMVNFYNGFFPGSVNYQKSSSGAVVSDECNEFRNEGSFVYVGNLARYARFKKVEVGCNPILYNFLQSCDPGFKRTHRQCQPSLRSGYKGAFKFNTLFNPDFDLGALDDAENWMNQHFIQYLSGCSVANWKTVFDNLNKKASTGFPINTTKYKNKGQFLLYENIYEFLDAYERNALSSNPFNTFWQISEKYEMRQNEKLDENPQKIRVFLSGSVDHVMLTNKYSLDFNNKFKTIHTKTWSKVGMTKYYRGWDRLYSFLLKHDKGFSLDCSNFDTCVLPQLFEIIVRFRTRCFSNNYDKDEIFKALTYIYESISYGVLVMEKGEAFWKGQGNTSGQGNTLVDNTLVSYLIIAYAYVVLCNQFNVPCSYPGFNQDIVAALTGDDNTCAVSERIRTFFNFTNVSKVFSKIGFTCTCDFPDFAPISDLEFLSHKFIFKNGFCLPLPDVNKMFSSLFYGDQAVDPRWVYLRVCAFRIEVYPDQQFFRMTEKILDFLHRNYSMDLTGYVKLDNNSDTISWEDIRALNFSEKQLDELYYGYESNCLLTLDQSELISIVLNNIRLH